MVAITQVEHAAINAREYPGTRQLCVKCGEPTERCEEDEIRSENGGGPFCVECWKHRAEIDKAEWIARCKAQFDAAVQDDKADWTDSAEVCYEEMLEDFPNDPEGAADEEMSNWGDDGE